LRRTDQLAKPSIKTCDVESTGPVSSDQSQNQFELHETKVEKSEQLDTDEASQHEMSCTMDRLSLTNPDILS